MLTYIYPCTNGFAFLNLFTYKCIEVNKILIDMHVVKSACSNYYNKKLMDDFAIINTVMLNVIIFVTIIIINIVIILLSLVYQSLLLSLVYQSLLILTLLLSLLLLY